MLQINNDNAQLCTALRRVRRRLAEERKSGRQDTVRIFSGRGRDMAEGFSLGRRTTYGELCRLGRRNVR